MKESLLTLGLTALLSVACSGENKQNQIEKEGVETLSPSTPAEVTAVKLEKSTFYHELLSNGKAQAREYADVYFQTAEEIAKVYVKNGDRVTKGQKLAELDKFKLNNAVNQARDRMEQARLDMKDVLIGQGYNPDRMETVPKETMKLAQVKSGFDQAQAQYELAVKQLEEATLTAPFSGLVANLFLKTHNRSSASEPFCRIINNREMEVNFTVLESELPLVRVGDSVEVTPYSSATDEKEGRITEVNPLVDENAMVQVKAVLDGGGQLFDGMNVRVKVRRRLEEKLQVPKSAVVLRSGRQVVFTLKEGKALWNYVQTGLENMDVYTIEQGLQEGDSVIVTGNLNLAHEVPVKLIRQEE